MHVQSGAVNALTVYGARARSACHCIPLAHGALLSARSNVPCALHPPVNALTVLAQSSHIAQFTYRLHFPLYCAPCAPFSALTAHWTCTLHCMMRKQCILNPICTAVWFYSALHMYHAVHGACAVLTVNQRNGWVHLYWTEQLQFPLPIRGALASALTAYSALLSALRGVSVPTVYNMHEMFTAAFI